jgi:hypothetical protein
MADIYGKIIAVLPTRSGTSTKGTQWSSQTAVVETVEQYPKRVAFDVMNDKIQEFAIQLGEMVTVSFDIDAHEYNGKWFNGVRAWRVARGQPGAIQVPQQAGYYQQQPVYNAGPAAGAQAAYQAQAAVMQNAQQTIQPNTPPFPPQQGAAQGNLPF